MQLIFTQAAGLSHCRNHGKIINATEGLGLLIADEGHRMKNSAETKTTRALKACPAVMRLVLVRLYAFLDAVMAVHRALVLHPDSFPIFLPSCRLPRSHVW